MENNRRYKNQVVVDNMALSPFLKTTASHCVQVSHIMFISKVTVHKLAFGRHEVDGFAIGGPRHLIPLCFPGPLVFPSDRSRQVTSAKYTRESKCHPLN